MNSPSAADVVNEQLRAYNARDIDAFAATDHEKTWGIQAEPVECAVVYEVHEGLITAVWFYEIEGASALPAEG